MNFDFSESQQLFGETVRRFLAERCPPATVRSVLDGARLFDAELYRGLADLGALGAAIPEEYGGIGLSDLETCVLAEELGRSLAPVPVASTLYLAASALLLAGSGEQKQAWLPGLAAGDVIGTAAIAEGGNRTVAATVSAIVDRGRLTGTKFPVPDGDLAQLAVVLARDADADMALSLFLVDLRQGGVARRTIETIDPIRNHAHLLFDNAPAERLGLPGDGWRIAEHMADRAAVFFAFEQIGGADRTLEMARDYALGRMTFGRQIGSYQALKHMMADMYVAAALARSNAYYGGWALSTNDPELPVAAATARLSATHAFQRCAKDNIQVHGGIGFSWELDCHLYYRRSNSLALALGSPSVWEDLLVDRLRRTADAAQEDAR